MFGWWLLGFYGISTFVGYLMPNPFPFQIIQFSMGTQFNCQKHFYWYISIDMQLNKETLQIFSDVQKLNHHLSRCTFCQPLRLSLIFYLFLIANNIKCFSIKLWLLPFAFSWRFIFLVLLRSQLRMFYSHEHYTYIYTCMQNHNTDTIKTSDTVLYKKNIPLTLLKVLCVWRQIKIKRSPDEQPFKRVWELVHLLNIVITTRVFFLYVWGRGGLALDPS